ncbi:MAG: pilus assembly protein [Litorimonas sp.]
MLKRYLSDTAGNISMMFAIVLGMLLLCISAALDLAGSVSQKDTMQSMSDAAALAAVTSGETKHSKIKKFVEASIESNNLNNYDLDWELKIVGDTVTVEIQSPYDTMMMGFVGKKELDVGVMSEAKFPEEVPINISLVLDRTGSMDGANMTSLKAAAAVLVDQFAEYEADTRVSVVPFSDYVNVGMSRRNENWISVPLDESTEVPAGECYMYQPRKCTSSETRTRTRTSDGVERTEEYNHCTNYVDDGPEKEYCPSPYTKEVKWKGCIGSRNNLYNKTAAYRGKRIPGIMDAWCGEEVLTLTDDMTKVKAKINSLSASGNTYIPVGLINGWRMLDADRPFSALSNKEEKRKRALILMTDGKNTLSLNDPYEEGKHTHSDEDEANDLTAELCENIKDANIDIWTVAYNFDDADSKKMLSDCASGDSQFFDASNQSALIAAFEEIGKSLFTARLSR